MSLCSVSEKVPGGSFPLVTKLSGLALHQDTARREVLVCAGVKRLQFLPPLELSATQVEKDCWCPSGDESV